MASWHGMHCKNRHILCHLDVDLRKKCVAVSEHTGCVFEATVAVLSPQEGRHHSARVVSKLTGGVLVFTNVIFESSSVVFDPTQGRYHATSGVSVFTGGLESMGVAFEPTGAGFEVADVFSSSQGSIPSTQALFSSSQALVWSTPELFLNPQPLLSTNCFRDHRHCFRGHTHGFRVYRDGCRAHKHPLPIPKIVLEPTTSFSFQLRCFPSHSCSRTFCTGRGSLYRRCVAFIVSAK